MNECGEPKGTMARWASTDSLSEMSYLECVWCFAGYDLNQFDHFHLGIPLQKEASLQYFLARDLGLDLSNFDRWARPIF